MTPGAKAAVRRFPRHFLGKCTGFFGDQRSYRTAEYLEVDSLDGYEIRRRRIFFDEVLLVTHHAAVDGWAVTTRALLAVAVGLLSLPFVESAPLATAVILGVGCGPLVILVVLRLLLPVEVVTVCGRRTRAEMRYWPPGRRGRDTYRLLCQLTRERQGRLTGDVAEAPPLRQGVQGV
jgi:hypothetical protein